MGDKDSTRITQNSPRHSVTRLYINVRMLTALLQAGKIAGQAEFINSANNTTRYAKIATKVTRNFRKCDKRQLH